MTVVMKLNILTDNLVSDLNIQKLNTNEKIALLRVLLSYTLTRPKVDTTKEYKSFSVKILD